MRTAAVIGAGWAGCAAAVELADHGYQVTLFEASRTLGGRARFVEIEGKRLDNGQHILLGAYRDTLSLMKRLGLRIEDAILRLPLQMRYPLGTGGMDFIAPRLPAPFHMVLALLRAKGLSGEDKLALARFTTTAHWMDWRLDNDCSVLELLQRYDQTPRLIQLMWRPLCIAALNTLPEHASAQVFLSVLRDSLGAGRAASDMLIPRADLTTLLPQQAARFIASKDGKVLLGQAVKSVVRDNDHWRVATQRDILGVDKVVVATPVGQTAALLGGLMDCTTLHAFTHEPITTCYLQYDEHIGLPVPFYALIDDPARQAWGQFVFDRGQIDTTQRGLLAVVVSASGEAIELGHEALTGAIARQLADALRNEALLQPRWSRVITEKRATFSCKPSLQRPATETGLPGLALAGDYCESDYPATLETAVRSGLQAARTLIKAD
jgi:squalene-associated FAD-dependent desaturase